MGEEKNRCGLSYSVLARLFCSRADRVNEEPEKIQGGRVDVVNTFFKDIFGNLGWDQDSKWRVPCQPTLA